MSEIKTYDVAVIGLGCAGLSALRELHYRGLKVIGLEQFSLGHKNGSTHGESRAIRQAYFEHPNYVPLLKRSYQLWDQWSEQYQSSLIHRTGCALFAPPDSEVLKGCLNSAQSHQLQHQLMSSNEYTQNQKEFNSQENENVFYESEGGYLLLDQCLAKISQDLKNQNCPILENSAVRDWKKVDDYYEIICGEKIIRSKKIIFSLGPWSTKNLLPVKLPLKVKRLALFWFDFKNKDEMPIFFKDTQEGIWFYGFPPINNQLKIAFHNVFSDSDPDNVDRQVKKEEVEQMEAYARKFIPQLGAYLRSETCLYTMTPDEHFIIDHLPADPKNLFLMTGFSGHGFKFMPVLGEIAADWAEGYENKFSLEFLSLNRFMK